MPEATNDLTTSVTETGKEVIDQLASGNANQVLEQAMPYLINFALAAAILIVGRMIAGGIRGVVRKLMRARKIEDTIIGFASGLLYAVVMVGVVMAALQKIGIQTNSFIAIIGAAGLAIGLALQSSLSNFAAGFMLIIFRPFKTGDFVEAGGSAGIVEEIGIFTTTLRTPDNRMIVVPNGAIQEGVITNVSAKPTRRIDLVMGVSYDDDIRGVKALLCQILDEDDRILKDPAYTVAVLELADSSVNFAVRPWVNTPDYWDVYFDLNEKMKLRIEEAGYSIPYPQQDLHLIQKTESAQPTP